MSALLVSYTPSLRADLTYTPAPPDGGAPAQLHDPVTERTHDLSPIAAALVARLDGVRPVAWLLAEVARALRAPPLRVERALRGLLLSNLLADVGTDTLLRLRAARASEDAAPLLLPETRFACQGSGDCCQSYSFGPLSEEDQARLAALQDDIARVLPDVGPGPYTEERVAEGGARERYLRTRDGEARCLFLQDDRRCGLHGALGAASKPGFCSDYPLRHARTAFGLRVYSNGECSCYSATSRSGPPLIEQRDLLRRLTAARPKVEHPPVWLDADTPCDYGYFVPLQDALCDLLGGRHASVGQTLLAMSFMLRAFVDRLRACALQPGEPARAVRGVLSRPAASFFHKGAGDLSGRTGRAGLVGLIRLCTALLGGEGDAIPEAIDFRNGRQLCQVLRVVRDLAGVYAGRTAGVAARPLQRVAAVAVTDPAIDDLLRQSLRQQVFGGRMLVRGRPVAALLRIGLGYAVTLIGARFRAAHEHKTALELQHFDHGHMLAQRVLTMDELAGVFVEHEGRAWDILPALVLLAGGERALS